MFSNIRLGGQGRIGGQQEGQARVGGQQKGQARAGGHDYSTAGRRRVLNSRTQTNGLRQTHRGSITVPRKNY
jgi:hypothetical protein